MNFGSKTFRAWFADMRWGQDLGWRPSEHPSKVKSFKSFVKYWMEGKPAKEIRTFCQMYSWVCYLSFGLSSPQLLVGDLRQDIAGQKQCHQDFHPPETHLPFGRCSISSCLISLDPWFWWPLTRKSRSLRGEPISKQVFSSFRDTSLIFGSETRECSR